MKYHHLLIATLAVVLAAHTASAGPADFPKYGFQIDTLDASPGTENTQALMMFLPSKNGFAANVNVIIQPFPKTLKDFIAVSKSQFEKLDWKVLTEKSPSDKEWICEYAGETRQTSLHWYSRAILKSGKVYLVTATAAAADWDATAPTLKKCVDSFALK
jgi:hypothetical protein